ncbi:MAG: RNA pyrophosphohydrolase [Deltaproteobacteria bacterium]|nr:RNA pyrophosphohydrolase [Deltaproteobacteria bacterium]
MSEYSYRKNVAAIIVNENGQMFIAARSDFPDYWQLLQGGIEPHETPTEALKRELNEEIGVTHYEVIAQAPHTIKYTWPKHLWRDGHCGQEQHYFLVRIHTSTPIDLDNHEEKEFVAFQWIDAHEYLKHPLDFKKEAYHQAIRYFLENHGHAFKK